MLRHSICFSSCLVAARLPRVGLVEGVPDDLGASVAPVPLWAAVLVGSVQVRALGVVEGNVGTHAATVGFLDGADVAGQGRLWHHLVPLHQLTETR